MDLESILQTIFNFENYGELLVLVQNSIWQELSSDCWADWLAPS